MRGRRHGLHGLVGAYVLDAVTRSERAAFERHLGTCEQCREDVRGLREAGARLSAAAAVRPRPELRGPTLAAAAVVRQLPPAVEGQRPSRLSRARRPAPGARSRWLPGLAAGLAAAFAAAAVLFGVHAGTMQQRLSAQQQRDATMTAVLGSRDAVARTEAVTAGGTATVVMSRQAGAVVFTASGLPPLPRSRGYELWLAGPSGAEPAGMVPAAGHGMAGPVVVGGVGPGEQLELTAEPAGGSRQPTAPPLVSVRLGS